MTIDKKILMFAGPNGAGKTTFAKAYLSDNPTYPFFLNADLFASVISPTDPSAAAIRAGRMMLNEMNEHTKAGRNFAFETTLSGRGYLPKIDCWRADGYHIKLIFLTLKSSEVAINRVRLRVAQGGHHIPEQVIRRRFAAGVTNFWETYRHRVDHWQQFDGNTPQPTLVIEGGSNR